MATFGTTAPVAVPSTTAAWNVAVNWASGASGPGTAHVSVVWPRLHAAGVGGAPVNVSRGSSVSDTTTPVAADGPLLVTVTV